MNCGVIAAEPDVRRQLVHFATDDEFVAVRSAVRNQRKAVFAGLGDVDSRDRTERSIVVCEIWNDPTSWETNRGYARLEPGDTVLAGNLVLMALPTVETGAS